MSDSPYWFLTVFALGALAFALAPLGVAWLWARFFSPRKPGRDKNATYECGLVSRGDARMRFGAEYYLYGIVFLIFEVEILFVLPVAVAFSELPAGALVALAVFLLLFVEGLVWAWAKGILDW